MTTYSVSSYAQLVSAMNAANASAESDQIYVTSDIVLTGALPTIGRRAANGAAANSGTLLIEGNKADGSPATISGEGAHQIFSVDSGSAFFGNLFLTGGYTRAGDGRSALAGGGGGLGAGGALLVNTGAAVTLSSVDFGNNQAIGGAAGASGSGSGGGLGGAFSGSDAIYINDDFGRGGTGALGNGSRSPGGFGAGDGAYQDYINIVPAKAGSALGGSVFVRSGASLLVDRLTQDGGRVTGGVGPSGGAAGSFLYTMGDMTLNVPSSTTTVLDNYLYVTGALTKLGAGLLDVRPSGFHYGSLILKEGAVHLPAPVGSPVHATSGNLILDQAATEDFDNQNQLGIRYTDYLNKSDEIYLERSSSNAPVVVSSALIGYSFISNIIGSSGSGQPLVFDRGVLRVRYLIVNSLNVVGGATLQKIAGLDAGAVLTLGDATTAGNLQVVQYGGVYGVDSQGSYDAAITVAPGGGTLSILREAGNSTNYLTPFTGVISGPGRLTLRAEPYSNSVFDARMTITGDNTYTGGTLVTGRTLVDFAHINAAGAGSVSLSAGAQTLLFETSALSSDAAHRFKNTISGFLNDGDALALRTGGAQGTVAYDASTHDLTVFSGGTVVATFHLDGDYSNYAFSTVLGVETPRTPNTATMLRIVGAGDGADMLTGGVFNDILNGGGGDDVLTGDAGADILSGGLGADTLNGGYGADVLYGNQDNDVLYGNQDDDVLYGGQGDDVAYGGQGNDALFGNLGDDVLFGNLGDDVLNGGAGRNVLDGGDGVDTVSYADATAGVSVSLLLQGSVQATGVSTDNLLNVENLTGSAFADTLSGDAGANVLSGGYGPDILSGGAGADVLYGNQDDDVLYGNQDADILFGGQGNDVLYGGQGNDVLNGNLGDDVLFGNLGDDLFVFNTGFGRDVIGDFGVGADRIQFTAGTFSDYADVTARSVDVAGGVLLTAAGGDTLFLAGVAKASLTEAQFIFG